MLLTIILDENLPHGLLRVLAPRRVTTVRQAGYAGVKNGALLAALDGIYDVFLTGDKNLRYQQNLTGRRLAIIELPTNRWPVLRPFCAQIIQAVDQCAAASYTVISAGS